MRSLIMNIWKRHELVRIILTHASLTSIAIAALFILQNTAWHKPINLIEVHGVYSAEKDNELSVGALILKNGKRVPLYCHNPRETINKGYRRYLSCPESWIPAESLDGMNAEANLDKNSGMALFSLYIDGIEVIGTHEAKALYGIK